MGIYDSREFIAVHRESVIAAVRALAGDASAESVAVAPVSGESCVSLAEQGIVRITSQ